MKKAAESQGMVPSGDTTNEQEEFEFRLRMEQEAKTKRRYTTEELDAMQEAEQSRNAAEEQRGRLAKQQAQLAKDNYACLLEYRTSAPVIQAPLGNDIGAVGMQGMLEQRREEKYVQACLESKGWIFPARNAESTK